MPADLALHAGWIDEVDDVETREGLPMLRQVLHDRDIVICELLQAVGNQGGQKDRRLNIGWARRALTDISVSEETIFCATCREEKGPHARHISGYSLPTSDETWFSYSGYSVSGWATQVRTSLCGGGRGKHGTSSTTRTHQRAGPSSRPSLVFLVTPSIMSKRTRLGAADSISAVSRRV